MLTSPFTIRSLERHEGVFCKFLQIPQISMAKFVSMMWVICYAALLLAGHGRFATGEACSSAACGEALLKEAREPAMVDWLLRVRRTLHEHPELKWEEEQTSALIRQELDRIGVSYEYPVAKHGVVAVIRSSDQMFAPRATGGPVVALRADMDALPIQVRAHCALHAFV